MSIRDKYAKIAIFLVLILSLIPLAIAESVIINPTSCTDSEKDCTLSNVIAQDGTEESQVGHQGASKNIRVRFVNSSAIDFTNPTTEIINVTVYVDRYESADPGGQTIEIEVTRSSDDTTTTCTLNAKTAEDNVYDTCNITSFITNSSNPEGDAESLSVKYQIQALGNTNYMYLDHAYVNITYNDTAVPIITLGNPVNDSWSSTTNVTFYFTPNDITSGIANCSLVINDVLNQSNQTTITENQENDIWTILEEGTYNWTVNCTDDSDNNNVGTNTSLKIINVDTTAPSNITLNLPVNNTNVSYQNITFNFTAYDSLDTNLSCSIYLNGTLNQTNSSVDNGTLTNFNINNIPEGTYEWNVSCADSSNNINWSTETRIFTIDLSAPNIISINFTPSSVDDIDPDIEAHSHMDALELVKSYWKKVERNIKDF